MSTMVIHGLCDTNESACDCIFCEIDIFILWMWFTHTSFRKLTGFVVDEPGTLFNGVGDYLAGGRDCEQGNQS